MRMNKVIIVIIIFLIALLIYLFNNEESRDIQYSKYEKIDLSNFTIDEIVKIPGIGIKKATEIKKYEEEYGFNSIEDLKKVPGIGEKTYQKIKKYFYISQNIYILRTVEKINLNTASYEELIKLPGIGEKSAKKIINYRKIKRIENLEELRKIGINSSQIKQIKGVVEF
ncbi:competence protein ComEA [Marinitoga sp. 1197]|uniref:ComEA family DNA-binding protein n=1 Tax=Marinitoga sp. 1197 TaxID=1428449 RepID=UPI000641148A|nr:helix-hairpin-helix domain-containing protein [Marinitoga sp. 1197]KLO21269.1 competence protein ComEA [Marinitoga sp. 1197]